MAEFNALKVDYTMLMQKSTEMHNHKLSFEDVIKSAKDTVFRLTDAWDSNAQKEFQGKFDRLDSTFKEFAAMLESYSGFLKESAGHYKTADDAIKNAINKF